MKYSIVGSHRVSVNGREYRAGDELPELTEGTLLSLRENGIIAEVRADAPIETDRETIEEVEKPRRRK